MATTRNEALRQEIARMLEGADFDGLLSMGGSKTSTVRALISMSYDKELLLSWRAMDAIGRVVATMGPEKGRQIVQRVLWMMRDESGSNSWTGPEILGEIVARNPRPFRDIGPIMSTFHDELIMAAGCMRAIWRIASVDSEAFTGFENVALHHAGPDERPEVRGYAALALGALDAKAHSGLISAMKSDTRKFRLYADCELREISVADAASIALGE